MGKILKKYVENSRKACKAPEILGSRLQIQGEERAGGKRPSMDLLCVKNVLEDNFGVVGEGSEMDAQFE